MQELYTYYKDSKDWNTAIDILKLVLSIDEKDGWARREIVDCFKENMLTTANSMNILKFQTLHKTGETF